MSFITLKGTLRLVGKTKSGNATGFEPEGDSMQFRPDQPKLLDRVEKLMSPYRLSSIGSTQLRFEGIDALELHFTAKAAGVVHQPRPLADDARDHLVTTAKLDPVNYPLSKFPEWLAANKERVLDLDTTNNTHFDTYVTVTGGTVKLQKAPDRLVFVSAKGKSPWL